MSPGPASAAERRRLTRRDFLLGAAAVAGGAVAVPVIWTHLAGGANGTPVASSSAADDHWLGAGYWGNRLQDWVIRNDRITCVAEAGARIGRTVYLLTLSLDGSRPFSVRVRTGTDVLGAGMSGFLIGTGELGTDYRRPTLVGPASGTAGGLFCVYGSDGRATFRDHTDEHNQFDYAEFASAGSGPAPARTAAEQVDLTLSSVPRSDGTLTLTLRAVDSSTGSLLSQAVLAGRSQDSVTGGISLVSSGPTKGQSATYWFQNVQSQGQGALSRPERGLGPVVGTLFSLSAGVLKMTAQIMPMRLTPTDAISLQVKAGSGWRTVAKAPIGPGWTALLRVEGWDARAPRPYRVVFSRGGTYEGTIPAEPGPAGMTVVTLSCTKATHRHIDAGSRYDTLVPGEHALGMYTSQNVYFPFERLVRGVRAQRPDVFVAMGDQFYEQNPTIKDPSGNPELDFLYKYLFWLWSFRDVTRDTPTLVLVDDHDVFQSNLFGESGAPLPSGAEPSVGGYSNDPVWINTVQRVQCGHNPDAFDPAPVERGITVYFTRFTYGGVRFVLLEDRKFKSGADGLDENGATIPEDQLQLLGPRQEAMLAGLAAEGPGPPTVVVSQTMYASLQTGVNHQPLAVRDSAGWPPLASRRALKSMAAARAVLLAGDTHLPALVRHVDGPVQFCGPAGGATFVRWFEPVPPLPNAGSQPYTGEFTDSYGNKMQVLAVANMKIDQAEWVKAYHNTNCGDQAIKEEGYGVLRIDAVARRHTFEAWRFDVDPTTPGARPMPGWPYVLPFDEA